jgi:hypothetical protein
MRVDSEFKNSRYIIVFRAGGLHTVMALPLSDSFSIPLPSKGGLVVALER